MFLKCFVTCILLKRYNVCTFAGNLNSNEIRNNVLEIRCIAEERDNASNLNPETLRKH